MISDKMIFIVTIALVWISIPVNGMLPPPRYQPELDQLSLEKYITDDYLFNMHINCLLYDGPCDPVGRWMRPRMASYFLNSCLLCTPNQEKETDKFITWLYENHPQLFRIGIGKYLDANGITLPTHSKFRDQVQNMNVPKVSTSSSEEESQEKVHTTVPDSTAIAGEKPETSMQNVPLLQPQSANNNEDEIGPNKRVLNSNARKNKFSSAIAFASPGSSGGSGGSGASETTIGKGKRFVSKHSIEDDEAEMDFKFDN